MSELLTRYEDGAHLAGTPKLALLLFTLAQERDADAKPTFGIDIATVREVVRAPAITRVPDTTSAALGMMRTRGALIPVVDVAASVGEASDRRAQAVIVTEVDGQMHGFRVEAVHGILRIEASAMRVPPAIRAATLSQIVAAVAELPDGRLVLQLDFARVLAAATGSSREAPTSRATDDSAIGGRKDPIPQLDTPARCAGEGGVKDTEYAAGRHVDILLFSVGSSETFGVDVSKVREVARTPRITTIPNVAREIAGVISLRGRIIPVLDFGARLRTRPSKPQEYEALLVTETAGQAHGLLVSEVERIARVDREGLQPVSPALAGEDGMVSALTRLADGRLVSIVDVERILNRVLESPRWRTHEARVGQNTHGVSFTGDFPANIRPRSSATDNFRGPASHAIGAPEPANVRHAACCATSSTT